MQYILAISNERLCISNFHSVVFSSVWSVKPFVITLRHFIVFLAEGCVTNIGSNSVVHFPFRRITFSTQQAKMCPIN